MENFIVHLLQCNEYRPTIHSVNQLEFLQFREYHWKNTEKDNLSGDCLTFSSIFSVCLRRIHIYVSLSRLSTCIFLCSLLISFHHFPWLSFRSMLTYNWSSWNVHFAGETSNDAENSVYLDSSTLHQSIKWNYRLIQSYYKNIVSLIQIYHIKYKLCPVENVFECEIIFVYHLHSILFKFRLKFNNNVIAIAIWECNIMAN